MYNLIVKVGSWADGRDTIPASRIFGGTDDAISDRYVNSGIVDYAALALLPTLFVEETDPGGARQVAKVGTITRAGVSGYKLVMDYSFDPGVPSIPQELLKANAPYLDIRDFEFGTTHWAVKDIDLFKFLHKYGHAARQRPNVFTLAEHENIEPSLMSAMMPFSPSFDPVYAKLKEVGESVSLRCRRADDFWENPSIIQDVVTLIDRSKVVVADCTGRNANVFYEVGIAHALGRHVILITQNDDDIPFDLRHLRYVKYLNNGEGLAQLANNLKPRLADLVSR